ncbi:hypothetical protein F511_36465 [Dorcoceras hygrometricum]|uniref:Uncharacterized protein n=1 Tax=Dorcoceras hygrometricum TaxID=472368 RepID=A0A2Z7AAU0_9LAMI|nr:hypothetical protein F511_36465 [Dorcoceras hygrometricum]
MTGYETPSSACTRRPDEISADGFSSSSWPEKIPANSGGGFERGGRRHLELDNEHYPGELRCGSRSDDPIRAGVIEGQCGSGIGDDVSGSCRQGRLDRIAMQVFNLIRGWIVLVPVFRRNLAAADLK